jgi:phage anti-repressor protein
MALSIVQQDIASLLDSWIEAERNGVQFPVPFDIAWGIAGYSTKASAKRYIKSVDPDHVSTQTLNKESCNVSGVTSFESITLSVDGLKDFCLLAKTEQGRQVRKYFIDAEKKWKLVQQVAPDVASEVEILHLKIELAKAESTRATAEKALMDTRHLIIATTPKPIADRILGVTEVVDVEYVDRTILPSGEKNDGVGITYLQKRYGFKTTKDTWSVLESVGCGKNSDVWTTQLRAVESSVIDRSILKDIDALVVDATRQINMGEGTLFS